MRAEVLRLVAGYPGYLISDAGRVFGRSGRELKTQRINSGYLIAHLCKNGKRRAFTVHRLVALAFLPADIERPHVNHKNGIKCDNRAVNLEWCDRSENNLHAYATGLREPPRFGVIGESLLDGTTVCFASQRDAELTLSGTKKQSSAINHCFSGRKKSAYGYRWRRA
jgi:hypothetical protein